METLRTEVIEDGANRGAGERVSREWPDARGVCEAGGPEVSDVCRLGARASGPSWPVIRRGRAAVCSTARDDRADGLGGVERGTADGVVVRGHAVRALAALVRALRGELPALASLSCPIN